jgi:MFS family permease
LSANRARQILIACCGAHLIQDGLVALQYVLLPILAQVFGLNYAQVGFLRAVSNVAMTLLEIPAGVLSERFGETRLLVFGLVCAALGYAGVALAFDFYLIVIGFFIAGSGAAFQHSLASALIANNFDDAGRRRSLGLYNAFGDAGKLTFTGIFSLAIGIGLAWSDIVVGLCLLTLVIAIIVLLSIKRGGVSAKTDLGSHDQGSSDSRWGIKQPGKFTWLGITVFIDSLVQAVFLTFVAFLLLDNGSSEVLASMAVVLVLGGGMVGKFCSGYLAARYGDLAAFRMLQLLTVVGLVLLTILPVVPILVLLPVIGMAVQGSSTVTYGAVSDFIQRDRQSRGYAVIYTLGSMSAVVGPLMFGVIADLFGLDTTLIVLAVLTSLTFVTGRVLQRVVPLAGV